jgi:hypothetical protein
MPDEIIPHELFKDSRPGYPSKNVNADAVQASITDWRQAGIRCILCLLDDRQLAYYNALPQGLLNAYREAGFEVAHLPIADHAHPPLSADEIAGVIALWQSLPRPLLIHCSAGIDRSGAAVQAIRSLGPPRITRQ